MALSCLRPDVATTFNSLDEQPTPYVLVHGELTFDSALLPVTDWIKQDAIRRETDIPARLPGQSLTRQGFTAAFDKEITLSVGCVGPWRALARSQSDVLAFVGYRDGSYVLALDPCDFTAFFDADDATLDAVAACMRGESCMPEAK